MENIKKEIKRKVVIFFGYNGKNFYGLQKYNY